MRLDGHALHYKRTLTAAAATATAATATATRCGDIATLLRHEVVGRVKGQGNNGVLGIADEGSHHAGGKAATNTACAATSHLERGIEHGADGSFCRSCGGKGTSGMRGKHIGIEELLGSLISRTPHTAATGCFGTTTMDHSFCYLSTKNDRSHSITRIPTHPPRPSLPSPFHLLPPPPNMSLIEYTTPTLNISPVRISTMVSTAHVGCMMNLEHLWEQVPIMPYWDLNDGILEIEYQSEIKGTSWKRLLQKAPATKKTFFFNQATIVIRREVSPLNWKEINIKLFRNGGVQMTGVRSEEMSSGAITWLIDHIRTHCVAKPVFEGEVRLHKMQTQLVNTDFSIGAKIRRDTLYKILSERYHLTVSYEPSIYQGVKTKFFCNDERPTGCPPGLCPCEKLCKGSGDGTRIGQCKKITISPFQTGQIIITGARTMAQINEAYEFMKGVFRNHADEILRKNYICPTGDETAAVTAGKKTGGGWIQHPSPRNTFKISTRLLVGI